MKCGAVFLAAIVLVLCAVVVGFRQGWIVMSNDAQVPKVSWPASK